MAAKRTTNTKWNPSHHPRDARGRFTRSATKVMKPAERNRAKTTITGFKPAPFTSLAARTEWLDRAAAATPSADASAIGRYLGGDWKTTNPALRAGKPVDGIDQLDAAFTDLPDDVMLRRTVPTSMFAHIDLDDLVGMKVRDAAPASTGLDHTGPGRPDAVTMHIAAPAGTPAFVNPDAGEVLLARDTEVAITKAVDNGQGGWDLYGVIIPKTTTSTRKDGKKPSEQRDQTTPNPAAGTADQGDEGTDGATAPPDATGARKSAGRDSAAPARAPKASSAPGDRDAGDGEGGGEVTTPAALTTNDQGPTVPDKTIPEPGEDPNDQKKTPGAGSSPAAPITAVPGTPAAAAPPAEPHTPRTVTFPKLWHVTLSTENEQKIRAEGFKIGTGDVDGAHLGQGVYLSADQAAADLYLDGIKAAPDDGVEQLTAQAYVTNPFRVDATVDDMNGGKLLRQRMDVAGIARKSETLTPAEITSRLQAAGYDSVYLHQPEPNDEVGGSQLLVFDVADVEATPALGDGDNQLPAPPLSTGLVGYMRGAIQFKNGVVSDPDVAAELRGLGLVDDTGLLTPAGHAALRADNPTRYEQDLVAGGLTDPNQAIQGDLLGGDGTAFVPQDRSSIGVSARADVGRERAIAATQQLGLFATDEREQAGQMAMLDALLAMPAAPLPPEPTPVDNAAPAAVSVVPDDVSALSDEQLAGLFADLSNVTDPASYDEAGLQRIAAEWDRREQTMQAQVAAVPDDLTTVTDDDLAQLFAGLTAGDGTMDEQVAARVEAELDRRDTERVAALEDLATKRALVAKAPATYADDAELEAAVNAAAELGDEQATERILLEWTRREEAANAEAAAQRAAAEQAETQRREQAVRQAEAAAYAEAGRQAELERVATEQGMLAARAAAVIPPLSSSDMGRATGVLGENKVRAVLGDERFEEIRAAKVESWMQDRPSEEWRAIQEGIAELPEADRARIVYAAADLETDPQVRALSDTELHQALTQAMFAPASSRDFGKNLNAKLTYGRETSRRALDKLRADEQETFARFRDRAATADPGALSDAELQAAPAVLVDDQDAWTTTRLAALNTEAIRRQNTAADLAARKAAGPAGPARVTNPVGELGRINSFIDSYNRVPAGTGAAERMRQARALTVGLVPDANEATIRAAERADERTLPDQSAWTLAWYRHLGEFAGLDGTEQDWARGPADQQDLTAAVPSLPGANVAKPTEVWEALKQQAATDRDQGDQAGAVRYTMALARAYGIPFDRTDTSPDALRRLGQANYDASRHDPRTKAQAAAAWIAEWRRLAAEDDVDPDDTLRYGPPDRPPVGKSKSPKATVTADQQIRINRLVAQGWDWLEAYGQVLKLDPDELRHQQATSAVTGGRLTAKAVKEAYQEHVHRQWLAAEDATSGYLLNKRAEAAGVDPRTLFSGSDSEAYRHASEELLRWWGDNPRMTFAAFKAEIGGAVRAARDRTAAGSKGNEFA